MVSAQVPRHALLRGTVLRVMLLGLGCWVAGGLVASLVVALLIVVLQWAGPVHLYAPGLTGLVAGSLFGGAVRSRSIALRGAVGGVVGMVVASEVGLRLLLGRGMSNWGSWIEELFLVFLCLVVSAIYGAVTFGGRTIGLFALAGLVVALPFTLMADAAMASPAVFAAFAAPVGVATGLAAGIHRSQQARRGGPPPVSSGRDTTGERRDE